MSAQCRVCQAKAPGGYLCRACLRTLEQAIAELPADLRDLQLVATRQATGPLGLGVGRLWDGPYEVEALGDAPWVFAQGAADQLWAAANTIGTWCRHLAESRGASLPRAREGTSVPLRPLVEWLLTNLDSIRYDEAAAEIHDELTGLHRENERWILGRQGSDQFVGKCDAPDVDVEVTADGSETVRITVAGTCGVDLYARFGEVTVRCQACGHVYDIAARKAWLLDQVPDVIAPTTAIANALTGLLSPVTPSMIRQMAYRGEIVSRGVDPGDTRAALYRVGDVLGVLAARAERKALRRRIVA